jgi:hypothetical protein
MNYHLGFVYLGVLLSLFAILALIIWILEFFVRKLIECSATTIFLTLLVIFSVLAFLAGALSR